MERRNANGVAEKLGQNLNRLRGMLGLTAATLAEAIGMGESQILQSEEGLERPTPEEAIALCEALNVKISQLMEGC